ncbi:MAG TPA: hypothetical protein DEQ17_07710 [Prevotella sp.]|nr:hypothetical protein [Prevotella sp.]
MKKGGTGGGNTITGLIYEGEVDLSTFIAEQKDYTVNGSEVLYNGECVAYIFKKYDFYRYLKTKGVDWRKHISRQLLPDNAIYVIVNNTMFILEVKTQQKSGSVDEKLQTCDFKKKQYQKLLFQLNMEVEYIYVLDEWFKQSKYKDVLDYIISVGCQYYFNYIPLQKLGLPVPK